MAAQLLPTLLATGLQVAPEFTDLNIPPLPELPVKDCAATNSFEPSALEAAPE